MDTELKLLEPNYRELLGGDLLAQSLKQLGVSVAFGIHGGHLDAFLIGASEVGIKLVDTRHETVAVQAAEGYAKVAGQVGVCFVTANSGFSNGLPGLATAYADRSPVFCITSSIPLRDAEANVLQGFHDQVVVAKPVTKFAIRVTNVDEIPRLVSHAFRQATCGAPGPVLIDFPIDVLFTPVNQPKISWGSLMSPKSYLPAPHPKAIQEAAQLIRKSKRPAFVTGSGAKELLGHKPWEEFIRASGIPVFSSNKWSTPLPFDHPSRGGLAANLTSLKPAGKEGPDVVVLLGSRTGFFFGSRSEPVIPKPDVCKYIHVDVDAGEVGRDIPVVVGITSDATTFADALAAELGGTNSYSAAAEWTKLATSLKSPTVPDFEKAPHEPNPGQMHPYHAVKNAFAALEPGAIVSTDGGDCGAWAVMLLENARHQTNMFSCGYLGFLGNGWGYSLGAAVAAPDKQIVNLQGDGSAGLHLAELDTFARHGCKVLTIVCNNSGWGMSASGQELIFGKGTDIRPATALNPEMSFETVAKGLGCPAVRVNKVADVAGAVQEMTKGKGPGLVELITSRKPIHPGTIAMVGLTEDTDEIVVPYYDNLPRPTYKIQNPTINHHIEVHPETFM